MDALSPSQRAELEQALVEREQALRADVHALRAELAQPPGETGTEVLDSGEGGQRDTTLAFGLADLGRAEHEIGEIAAARQRMRTGHYGYCEACGEPIPFERLRVLPTTRYCVRDEEKREAAARRG